MLIEVCCTDIQSVRAAKEGGADRVELCVDIEEDGLTPPAELIRQAVQTGLKVHVLVRPRAGNFVYDEAEAQTMISQIREARENGAHGVVVGALREDGTLDKPLCQRMAEAAKGMSLTFHRAFDVCQAPLQTFDDIATMGFDRLLTSGQAAKAIDGTELIKQLVERSHRLQAKHPEGKRIIVMAGSGVSPHNASQIVKETGVTEIHGTFREIINGQLITTAAQVKAAKDSLTWSMQQ